MITVNERREMSMAALVAWTEATLCPNFSNHDVLGRLKAHWCSTCQGTNRVPIPLSEVDGTVVPAKNAK